MKKLVYILFFATSIVVGQTHKFIASELDIPSVKVTINGTLLTPNNIKHPKLLIIIPGSGPTDRNGNQGLIQTNATKYLAEALSDKNIATYRYDKSVLSLAKQKNFKEENVKFDDFVEEASSVVKFFKSKNKFSKIIVAGHSQGSLVAMFVANKTDGYISLDGAGRPIGEVIFEQINNQAPFLAQSTQIIIDSLKQGNLVKDVPPLLISVFRPSIQPFLISWMKYNPQTEIEKIKVPILLINGSKDIQVPALDAKQLHTANPKSELKIIENMNHIFKEIKGDITENRQSYTNPKLPVMQSLVQALLTFINKI